MEVNSEMQIDTEPVASTACPKCGAVLDVKGRQAFSDITCASCRFEFVVPARFGPFLLLKVLGMGGMGGVYRARDEALNREVAIKVMQKSLGSDPVFVANFQREAQSAARLNHPNIGQIYSFGQAMGQPYIVMELISGGSLDRMMSDQGPLDPAVVFHVGLQIAEGLREAAEAGLVHGDVKPENILFDNDKNAKLLDFGLAAMNKSPTAEIWGTPFYIPPEKVKKQPTDFRSDIYSLGATLYHAIAGVPPFDGTDVSAVVKARFIADAVPLRNLRGSIVPEEVDAIILRMMAKEPSKRYPTYGSLLSDMRRYLAKAGPVNLTTSSKKITIKGKRPQPTTAKVDQPSAAHVTTQQGKSKFTIQKSDPANPLPMNKLDEEFAEIVAQKRKAKKMVSLIIFGTVAGISLLVVSLIAVFMQIERKNQQREKEVVVKRMETSNAAVVKAVTEARKFVAYINENVGPARKYADDARDAVVAALGEEVRPRLAPPEPEYVVPSVDVEVKEPPAPEGEKVPPATTNEVKAAEGVNKKGAAPVFVDDQDEEIKTKYPIAKKVRGMYLEAYRVKYASVLASAMLVEIETLSARAEKLTLPEQAAELEGVAKTISEQYNTMGFKKKELTEVARNVSGLKKSFDSVKAEATSLLAVKRLQELEQERVAKREAEEAKKRQEDEALAAKTKADCDKIAEVEASNVALLKALRFQDAARALRRAAFEVKTKGGEEALEVAQERIRRVEEVIKTILDKAKGYKSKKGWMIEEVNAKTLTVSSKEIAWAEVFNTRAEVVSELINDLVLNPSLTQAMRVRERTRLEVSVALCLWMYYPDMPAAVERAKQIAKKAAQDFPLDADITRQLMPGILE